MAEVESEQILPESQESWNIIQVHMARYSFGSRNARNRFVLDLGCGAGYGSFHLASRGASWVVAGDLSQNALSHAKKYYQRENIDYLRLDAQYLPFKDHIFDLLLSFEIIEHLPSINTYLSDCRRVTKGDGTLVFSTPNKHVTSPGSVKPVSRYHIKEFVPDEFFALLSTYFPSVDKFGQLSMNPIERSTSKIRTLIDSSTKKYRLQRPLGMFTRRFARKYQFVRMIDLKDHQFEKVGNEYLPFPFEKSKRPPFILIAQCNNS